MPEKNVQGATSDFFGAGCLSAAHSALILNSKTELKRQWSSILRPSSMQATIHLALALQLKQDWGI